MNKREKSAKRNENARKADSRREESRQAGKTSPAEKKQTLSERWKGAIQICAAILITALVIAASPYIVQFRHLGYMGAFIISLLSSATVIIPAPGWIVIVAMGRMLDPIVLGIVAGVGAGIGELTGYMVGYGSREVIEGENAKKFAQQKEWLQKSEVITIFVLAAIPNPLFDLAGIAAGALKMPWWKFLLACIAGKIVKFVAFAYLGLWSIKYF